MTTFKTTTIVDLDPQWVEDLLVTAFDSQYGGCWYWINEEEDIHHVTYVRDEDTDKLVRVVLTMRDGKVKHLGKPELERGWATIVDTQPIREDLVRQLTRSQHTGDLDVDADAADCLVQIALYGEVVYG